MSNFEKNSDATRRQGELFQGEFNAPGCLDADGIVRASLAAAFKLDKSREAIADEMTHLVGREITVAMLDSFTADSKRNHRFPAAWIPAFCTATGDPRLLLYLVQRTGHQMITSEDARILALGRKLLEQQIVSAELNAATEALMAERAAR